MVASQGYTKLNKLPVCPKNPGYGTENENIFKLCLKDYLFRSYHCSAELTFKYKIIEHYQKDVTVLSDSNNIRSFINFSLTFNLKNLLCCY